MDGPALRRLAGLGAGILLGFAIAQGAHFANPLLIAAVVLIGLTSRELAMKEHTLDGVWPIGVGACGFLAVVSAGSIGLPPCTPGSVGQCATRGAQFTLWFAVAGAVASLAVGFQDVFVRRWMKRNADRSRADS